MTNIEKLLIDNGFELDKRGLGYYVKWPVSVFVFVDTLTYTSFWYASIEGFCFKGEFTSEETQSKCDEIKHATDLLFEIVKKLNALENPWDEVEEGK